MSTYLGIDYGERRTGVALGADEVKIARPLTTLPGGAAAVKAIKLLAVEHGQCEIVLGLPRGLEGQETAQTRRVRQFARELQSQGLIVHLQDEAMTSELATARGVGKGEVDQVAAALILQDYLDGL